MARWVEVAKLRVAVRKFGAFEAAVRKQYASFRAATGCALDLEAVGLDLNPLVETLFTSGGLADGTWDVAFVVTDWIAEAVESEAVVDLAPYLREHPIPDYPEGWPPSLTGYQQFDDALYGLPYHDGPECLIYRADLFADPAAQQAFLDRHGYPLAPPTTWRQFEEVARFFTRPEQGRYGTIFAAYPDGHNTVYDFCLQLWSRGGELADQHGIPSLATPQAVAALDFYRRLVKDRSVTPPDQERIDSVQSGERFASGEIAMMVNWFGFAAACEQPESPTKGKVAVAPPPAAEGFPSASLNVYWLLCVAAGSRHKEEAVAFVRHCCTPEMDKLTTLEGGIGCRLSTWCDPEVNTIVPYYHRLAEIHRHARTLPRSRRVPELVALIDQAVQAAISGEEPTAEILGRAQAAAAVIRL
jgi:multiple sugar transport system substrate-binding protein